MMSPLKNTFILLLFVVTLTGCSTENPDAVFGAHPDGWLLTHGAEANTNLSSCQSCHGLDFTGSGNIPSCFTCHTAGPPFEPGAPHDVAQSWLLPTGHVAAALANNPPCFDCHTQTAAEVGINPACQDCHTTGDPSTITNCTSCHNIPPDSLAPQGAKRPNLVGKHSVHDGFTATTTTCTACHSNGGTGSLSHYDRTNRTAPNYPAEVTFLSLYNAKTGGAGSYNDINQTCSNISCHGGQTTPDWTAGTVNVTSDCISCHRLTTVSDQFNSYGSGRHSSHAESGGHADGLGYNPTCSACHNATNLPDSGHFSNLDTAVVEGNPIATLLTGLSYDNTTDPGNPTCTTNIVGCHSGATRIWGAAAGAPHPVDDSYRASTAHGPDAKFNQSNCQTCHATPGSGGPNPQFTVDIIQDKLTSAFPAPDSTATGCMKCHNDNTAHPSEPGMDNVRWYDAAPDNLNVTHNDAGGNVAAVLNANCGLCHSGLAGSIGTVGTNCTFCHVTNPVGVAVGTCTSCHNTPPSGNNAPNRQGTHDKGAHRSGLTCDVCHTNNGPDGSTAAVEHFTYPNPNYGRADLRPAPNQAQTTMTITPTATNVTCTGRCHSDDKNHNEQWY